ncbi:MAG: hypothetical protein APF84_13140 [Gracilibacter sp. BRH_c7a]|nr:MAG: hypothetical protein APF84_13140 [Gracilibacter sp. BRH_c7a]
MGNWEEWSPMTGKAIDNDMVEKLLLISIVRKFKKGEIIYWDGLDNSVYLLLSGKVEISIVSAGGRKRTLAIREARTFIDDAMIDGYFYAVTISCLTPVEVAIFEQETLIKAGYEDPEIFLCMLKSAILKLQGLSLHLARQTFDEVESRVYFFLLHLAEKNGVRMDNGICIEQPLTHQFIADIVGSTRVRVTQILKNMSEQGIIGKNGRKLVLYTNTDNESESKSKSIK